MWPVSEHVLNTADRYVKDSAGDFKAARLAAVEAARRALCAGEWDVAETLGDAAAVIAYQQARHVDDLARSQGVLL
jgi:hypothetical protein